MSAIGRVLDPTQLDACDRSRGRHRIEVPAAWLSEKTEVELTVPALLACAGCDGGGCGACGRSGALRAPAGEVARTLRVCLPHQSGPFVLRIPSPFGPEHPVAQLLLEVHGRCSAASASQGVRRLNPSPPSSQTDEPAARRWRGRARSRCRPELRWRYVGLVVALVALAIALVTLMARPS